MLLEPRVLDRHNVYIGLNPGPCRSLSTTVHGGGWGEATGVLLAHVEPDYDCPLPGDYAEKRLLELGLPRDTIVFLTAADVTRYAHAQSPHGRAEALATLALTHPACPTTGDTGAPGVASTVNLLVAVRGRLTPSARVDAFRTASETKAAFLALTGLSCGRNPAWSTVSDATALLECGEGPREPYAGPGTHVGREIAQAVLLVLEKTLHRRPPSPQRLAGELLGHAWEELLDAALRALESAPIPGLSPWEARRRMEAYLEEALRDPNVLLLLTAARLAESSGVLGAVRGVDLEMVRGDSGGIVVDELLAWALSYYLGGFRRTLAALWVDRFKERLGIRGESVFLDDMASALVGYMVSRLMDEYHGNPR